MDNIGVVDLSDFVEFKDKMRSNGEWYKPIEVILDKYLEGCLAKKEADYVTALDDVLLALTTMTVDKPEEAPAPDSWEEFVQILEQEVKRENDKSSNQDTTTE